MSVRSNKRLMIVDDHPEMRRALRDLLGQMASDVCECTSGEEAIQRGVEQTQQGRPALLLPTPFCPRPFIYAALLFLRRQPL